MVQVLFGVLIHGLSLGKITGLYRYAVKGLSGDTLDKVRLAPGETFPDDRRFALLKTTGLDEFDPQNPAWLPKENFLCSFTDPQLMAKYRASYSTQSLLTDRESNNSGQYLSLYERWTKAKVLGPLDLSTERGRQTLATFFSLQSGTPITCITADTNPHHNDHRHQFGNTSSGWKQNRDTRTIHIVAECTVKALATAIGGDENMLSPTRFRPNIVLSGENLRPFSEFDWIGKSIHCSSSLRMKVISKTVRCKGVSTDPLNLDLPDIDIPGMLVKHFPEHGPYLGVYAVVESGGDLGVGDDVFLH